MPQGVRLGQDNVRFADLTGNGTADLIVSTPDGDHYFPNDPDHGILAGRRALLAPDFGLGEEGSWLLDIDGDGVADLLTFRNGVPMAFFNEGVILEEGTPTAIFEHTRFPETRKFLDAVL